MADNEAERLARDDQIRESILAKLVESGEKDRLKEILRNRLNETGWKDQLKEFCKEVIRKKGLEKISIEDLVAEITPHGRETVPEDIKVEVLKRIRVFLQST